MWFPPQPKEGTVMIKDAQVRKLRQLLGEGNPLYRAALRVGMDAKSARKYRHADRLPSESLTPRTWRTREDPFQDVWPQLRDLLELNPGLQAKTLFEDLQRRFPGRFPDIQLRTLQRKIKAWRATEGPAKEVFFDQIHRPGQLAASDFTHMNDLHVTLAGEPFDHMIYHFVLTYSNWETATVCFSESFESLSQGLQNALWELGGVPQMHRTDRLSAAVNNLGDRDLFQQRYRALLAHYGLKAQAINARKAHENGDAEQSHHRFKTAVDQALMLRGSRDFEDREDYERFLRELQAQRNSGRTERFGEDRSALGVLPARRVDAWRRCPARVTQGSTIRIGYNTYSVPSRLIGEKVDVHIKVECLEVWHGTVLVERLPRLRGRNQHEINYRHVIDWLVRKPGAFAGYRYQDAMFPTSRFRRTYDALLERSPGLRGQGLFADPRSGGQAIRDRGRCRAGPAPGVECTNHADRRRRPFGPRSGPAAGDGGHDHNGGFVDVRPITRDQGGHAINRPTDLHESLKDCLRDLHLPTIRDEYEAAAQRARQESLSYERYLLDLTERERETRRSKRIERLLRESRLFMEKSLSTLDLKRLPPKAAQQVRSLLEGGFVDRHENVSFSGTPALGKRMSRARSARN